MGCGLCGMGLGFGLLDVVVVFGSVVLVVFGEVGLFVLGLVVVLVVLFLVFGGSGVLLCVSL